MQIVTLTTDWGVSDHYVGAVKGKLYSTIKDCNVVDISHDVKKFDIMHGAFIVRNACLNFPKSTIHIIDVDCTESSKKKFSHILIQYNDQYFICTDNGMPSLIFEGLEIQKIIELRVLQETAFFTFSAHDLFCKVAALIVQDSDIEKLGGVVSELKKGSAFVPVIYEDSIFCRVFHVDSYGNLFLNINSFDFEKAINGKSFSINIEGFTIKNHSDSYDKVRENTPLLTISSTNHLQLAINKGNASNLLGLSVGSSVKINIDNQDKSQKK